MIQQEQSQHDNLVIAGDIQIDTVGKEVIINGHVVSVTLKEYMLLCLFASNPNKVFTIEDILQAAWHSTGANEQPDIVYTHIKNLRRKLEAAGSTTIIRSIYGAGYKLKVDR